jgi:hypothetical protein
LSRIILFNVSKFCKNLVSITGKTKEEVWGYSTKLLIWRSWVQIPLVVISIIHTSGTTGSKTQEADFWRDLKGMSTCRSQKRDPVFSFFL